MKRNVKGMLLAVTAGALMMSGAAMAQAPAGGPGVGGPGGMRGGMGGGMGAPMDRAGTIQRYGLGDAALKLTDAQKMEIDKAADAYVTESNAVNTKYPMTQGTPPSAEATAARTKARDNLNMAVGKVLNAEQKKTWDAAQAARRPPGGGMGGPGGGMGGGMAPGGPGGPGGARPPGQ